MKQVKNLSNVNNFEDLAKVYKNRQSKLDKISALDGGDVPAKPNQTQPRRSKQRKTLGQHDVYSESTLPYTNHNFSDLAKTEGAHTEMKTSSLSKQQEMIKKYQVKNERQAYLTKSGHILPEILTKSDKKLANAAKGRAQAAAAEK